MAISKATFSFLSDLEANNNRDWFNEHKVRYTDAHTEAKAFMQMVTDVLNQDDEIEKSKLFRIYRDVRFSKDKTPFKSHFSMSFARATAYRRGGYYLMVKPNGESMVGGGFYNPESADLKLIRSHIAADDAPLRKIIGDSTFVELFGTLRGDQVKTAPKGYAKDHPAIDLLRYKSMYVMKTFSDKEVQSPQFIEQVKEVYAGLRPFFDYMSDILTHDLNGLSLIDK